MGRQTFIRGKLIRARAVTLATDSEWNAIFSGVSKCIGLCANERNVTERRKKN